MAKERLSKAIDKAVAVGLRAFQAAMRSAIKAQFPTLDVGAASRNRSRAASVPAPKGAGSKRSKAELENTTAACLAVIRRHPGIIPEQIAHALGVAPKDVALPLQRLRERGAVTCTGAKRFTRHTAV